MKKKLAAFKFIFRDVEYKCTGVSEYNFSVPLAMDLTKYRYVMCFNHNISCYDCYSKQFEQQYSIRPVAPFYWHDNRRTYINVEVTILKADILTRPEEDASAAETESAMYFISHYEFDYMAEALDALDRIVKDQRRNWEHNSQYEESCRKFQEELSEKLPEFCGELGLEWEMGKIKIDDRAKREEEKQMTGFPSLLPLFHYETRRIGLHFQHDKIQLPNIWTDCVLQTHDLFQRLERLKTKQEQEYERLWQAHFAKMEQYAGELRIRLENQGVLSQPALPTWDKLEELKRFRELCLQYLPELKQGDKPVRVISQRCADYLEPKVFRRFEENWDALGRAIAILQTGKNGEEAVARVLRLLDDKLVYLQNYCWGREHDFVVLAPSGIFTIEVKNLSGNCVITETGLLRRGRDFGPGHEENVAMQSLEHIHTLRRHLKDCPAYKEDVPIQEIICSANEHFRLQDNFHKLPVCYPVTLPKTLFPEQNGRDEPPALSWDAIQELKDFLISHQEAKPKYDLFSPKGELSSREDLIQDLAAITAAVKFEREEN